MALISDILGKTMTLNNKLTVYKHPCKGELLQPEPLVLIHGWGSDSHTWDLILPELIENFNVLAIDLPGFGKSEYFQQEVGLCEPTTDEYLDAILAVMPSKCSIMGWSLGGLLATSLVGREPSRFTALITVATNPCFVQRVDWHHGMSKKIFNNFLELFKQQPALCLKRFHALQCSGDIEERALFKILQKSEAKNLAYFSDINQEKNQHIGWLRGLRLLAETDNRVILGSLQIPGLHIFGEVDQLVTAGAANEIKRLNSSQQVKIIDNTAHLLHISSVKKLTSNVLSFFEKNRYFLDKKKVAASFSGAANSYDSASRLQRQVGKKLLSLLPDKSRQDTVIDLGCGTGFFVKPLLEKHVSATIIGVDIAQGMLKVARSEQSLIDIWLCADAEKIPLADNSVDVVFSNLAFQWCSQLPILAQEIARIVKPGGRLAFTSVASGTLSELKASWVEVDSYVHVNKFLDSEKWKIAFSQEGFDFQEYQAQSYKLVYRDIFHLMRELKDLGAHNLNAGQKKSMTSLKNMRALIGAYDKFRDSQGKLPATWQIVFGVGVLNV